MTLKNKKILIIIGGGIAAYKTLDLIRLLKKNGAEIKTILTKSGKEFVTSLSITTLTGTKTFENLFDKELEEEIDHIGLSRWADIIIYKSNNLFFFSRSNLYKFKLQKNMGSKNSPCSSQYETYWCYSRSLKTVC